MLMIFGMVKIEDSTSSVYKVRIKDFEGNESWITIPIKGQFSLAYGNDNLDLQNKHFAYADQLTTLSANNISVFISKNTLYDDFVFRFFKSIVDHPKTSQKHSTSSKVL